MLGLSPSQDSLEAYHSSLSSASSNAAPPPPLLANSCLDKFAAGSSVGLGALKLCGRTSTVKLVFGQLRELTREKRAFAFGPSYLLLSGRFSGAGAAPQPLGTALAAAKEALVAEMLVDFWSGVDAFPYAACDEVPPRPDLPECIN
jgi:hypothetical protein